MISKNILFYTTILNMLTGGVKASEIPSKQPEETSVVPVSPMIEVGENDAPSEIPNTGTWFGGSLNISSKCYDMLIAGKCEVNAATYQLGFNIEGAEKIPDFFTLNSEGQIVFAEPSVVCTIEKPRGHNEKDRIVIRLERVATEEEKFRDYICLGIRENGVIVDRLHDGNPFRYINTEIMTKMELIPLVSKTKMSEGYEEIEPGTKISATSIPFPTSGIFNFGTVYRIKIGNPIEWEKHDCVFPDSDAGTGNNGRTGVGTINGKENQLLSIRANGELQASSDGITWVNAGSVYKSGETSSTGWSTSTSYGNGIWCAANLTGQVRYKADNDEEWSIAESTISSNIMALAFYDNKFVAVSGDGKMHTSTDANTWSSAISIGIFDVRILGYGNNKWICSSYRGNIRYSTDGINWISKTNNLSSFLNTWLHGGGYIKGYFYVIDAYGSVVRSPDGIIWTRVSASNCSNGHNNITPWGEKLHVLGPDGTHCHIGTLDPNDVPL